MDQPLQKTVQNCRMRGLIVGLLFGACFPAWSAHAYAQFGDIKYPPGFQHFDYVNPKAPKGGEISLVPPTRLSNFDKYNPFTLKGSAPPSLVGLVFETLLTGTLDEPTTAYGLLAEDVAVAPDRLSVVFRLHPAARFSNGDPVLAADVKHSFDRLVSKESAPQYRTIFGEVRGATILGERTIRFDFKRVNAELPLIVGGLPVFSRQWGMEKGKAKPLDQIVTDMPIGSGPYRVGKVSFGRDITYERDPHYWAKDLNVRRGLLNFDRITYKIYKDNTAQLEAFKAGEFDYIQAFIAREWARAYSGKQFDSGQLIKKELKHGNAGDFQGFQFNTRRDKFKDPRVREAIGLAMAYILKRLLLMRHRARSWWSALARRRLISRARATSSASGTRQWIPHPAGRVLLTPFLKRLVMQFVPGGPVEQYMAEAKAGFGRRRCRRRRRPGYRGAQGVDPKRMEQIKALYGFDKPRTSASGRCWAVRPFDLGKSFFRTRTCGAGQGEAAGVDQPGLVDLFHQLPDLGAAGRGQGGARRQRFDW
jgi:ABC-type transport system substrate-binding protein